MAVDNRIALRILSLHDRVARYLVALAVVAAATLFRFAVDPLLHDQVPYFVYVAAVAVATWFAGAGPGIVVTVASAFVGNYLFVAPRHEIAFNLEDAESMGTFVALSIVLVWLVAGWRHAEREIRALHARSEAEAETARQRAEELQAILDTVPAGVLIAHDADARTMTANRFMSDVLQLPSPTIRTSGEPGADGAVTFRATREGRRIAHRELPVRVAAARGIEVREAEIDVIRRDGAVRTLFGNASPLLDSDGHVRGAVGAFIDVTDRNRMEAELRTHAEELERHVRELKESEARYRIMGETLPYGVWLCGPDGGAIYTSQSFLELLDMSMEEMQQFGWTNRLVPGDVEPMMKKWLHCIETGEMWDSEHRIIDRHGEIRTVLTRGLPVRDEHGQITCWVGVNLDITARKDMERRLREQADELARANRMKDEFLGTLSHELRTPLNAILGWSDLMMRGRLDAQSSQRALEAINRNAHAQAAIIADVLDVSRIVSGKMRLDVRPVEVGAVLAAAIDTAKPAADARQITIDSTVEPGLLLLGDPDRLQQVFWNLLSNAVKFSPPEGRIAVTAHRAESQIEVRISDTGKGIPSHFLPHVFERFRQLDSSTTRSHQAGLGLGLAIVRHLAELHGGSVSAESAGEGSGATFIVRLPVRAVFDATSIARVTSPLAGEDATGRSVSSTTLTGLRVLVVDDQADARTLVEAVLRDAGAQVTSCASALAAMEVVQRESPHVMLADIGMPEIDGYELVRRVRTLAPAAGGTIACIALTAYGAADDRRRALESGFDEHIVKPVMPEHLIAVVSDITRRSPLA